jgi:hypothetical protein
MCRCWAGREWSRGTERLRLRGCGVGRFCAWPWQLDLVRASFCALVALTVAPPLLGLVIPFPVNVCLTSFFIIYVGSHMSMDPSLSEDNEVGRSVGGGCCVCGVGLGCSARAAANHCPAAPTTTHHLPLVFSFVRTLKGGMVWWFG